MRKPRFSRHAEWVCVRPFRLASKAVVNPGDPIVGLRMHRLRSLYQRNRIGPVGSPWTEAMLKDGAVGNNPHRAIVPASIRRLPQIRSGYTPEQYAQLPTPVRAMIETMNRPDLSKDSEVTVERLEAEKLTKEEKAKQKEQEKAHKKHMEEREAAAKAKREEQQKQAEQEAADAEAAAKLLQEAEQAEADALVEESEDEAIDVVGGGWYNVTYGNAVVKVKGKANAEKKLAEMKEEKKASKSK